MRKIILSLLLLLLILVLFPKTNENFEQPSSTNKESRYDKSPKGISSDKDEESGKDESRDKKEQYEEYSDDKDSDIPKKINNKNKEKYYDYNINYNTRSFDKIPSTNDKAININIGYPSQQPFIQQQPSQLVNNTLLSNLVGTPVDQVETDYTVTENSDIYKARDKYYLPGYSYFPPSKWQLPKDNAILIPRELRDEKCDVCPLIANNGSDNYLSGDILQGPNNTYKITPQTLNTQNPPSYDPVQSSLNLNNVENPYVADFVRTNRRHKRQQKRHDREDKREERRENQRENRRENKR